MKKAPTPALSEFAPFADELGALEKEMAPYAQKLARIAALKKALRAGCPNDPSLPWSVEGVRFIAQLGACANERAIDLKALIKAIGLKAFAAFATTTLTALENNVGPAIVAAVVSTDATGSRSIKTFEKGTTT
jgi:hypothetical protein